MLKAKARVKFTVAGKDYDAHDRFDVAFRFAENLLFSGRIKGDVPEYKSGEEYSVDVDFFTIDNEESYSMVKPTLSNGVRFVMCAGSRIMGDAIMDSFTYPVQTLVAAE